MFCIYCGAKIDNDSSFCTVCGKKTNMVLENTTEGNNTITQSTQKQEVETLAENTTDNISDETELKTNALKKSPKFKITGKFLRVSFIILAIIVGIIWVIDSLNTSTNISATSNEDENEDIISEDTQYSQTELLNEYLELITPITDSSISLEVNEFTNYLLSWVDTRNAEDVTEMETCYEDISTILDEIINKEIASGYGFQAEWENLTGSCLSLEQHLYSIIEAVYDNDSSTALSDISIYDYSDLRADAITLENKINLAIQEASVYETEVEQSEETASEKAYRYARYYYNDENIVLECQPDYIVVSNLGKFYEFKVIGLENTSILVDVADGCLVRKEDNSHIFVPDTELPALEGELAMPDVIGMTEAEAIEVIESLGYSCETNYMKLDGEEKGTVYSSSPEAGKALLSDTRVSIIIVSQYSEDSK